MPRSFFPAALHTSSVSAVLALALISATRRAAAANPDAVAYQNNPAHDGSATFQNFSPTPSLLWSVNLGNSVSYPLIAQGEVYVTAGDNSVNNMHFYALNAATGHIDWSVALTSLYWGDTAAYDNGKILLVNGNFTSTTMNAYNAATGSPLWSTPLTGQYLFSSPPTASNGIVYTGGAGSGGTLYAVRESDGVLLWHANVENGDHSAPAVTSTGVYVSYAGPQTYDFNPTSGAAVWHYDSGIEGGGGKTPVFYNGLLYVRDDGSSLRAFNASTGAAVAAFTSPGGVSTVPAFSNHIGFVPIANSNTFDAFNPATGAVLWSKTLPSESFVTAPIIINNVVFEGTSGGNLYEYDGATGNLIGITNVGFMNGPDEQNVSQPLTGLAAGDGLLAIPMGSTLSVYSVPEPATLMLLAAAVPAILRRSRRVRGWGRA